MNLVCQIIGHDFGLVENGTYAECKWTGCKESHRHYRNDSLEETQKSYKFHNTFWDSAGLEVIKIISGAILGIAVLFVLVSIPLFLMGRATCNAYSGMGVDVLWNFWTGCMAKHSEFGWLPIEQYFNSLNLNLPK